MLQQVYPIRPIQSQDNAPLAELIVSVVQEYGCSDSEYIRNRSELAELDRTFREGAGGYWVALHPQDNRILGGGGYTRLKGTAEADGICELQKLYLLPEARGTGLGRSLMDVILHDAREKSYKLVYLECVPQLIEALKLYERLGFQYIDAPLGNTGHKSCTLYMTLAL